MSTAGLYLWAIDVTFWVDTCYWHWRIQTDDAVFAKDWFLFFEDLAS